MIALKKVLVATDFSEPSEAALAYGRELARSFSAQLIVLHVVENTLTGMVAANDDTAVGRITNRHLTGNAALVLVGGMTVRHATQRDQRDWAGLAAGSIWFSWVNIERNSGRRLMSWNET